MAVTKEKMAAVAEIKEKLEQAKVFILADYRGLTVAQDTKFRTKMREAGVDYSVVKNSRLRIAAEELGIEGIDAKFLSGPTAIAISYTDPVAPAKVLNDFVRENRLQFLQVKGGVLDGKLIDANSVKALATLPSKEELLAKALGSMQAPISGFVNVLSGTVRNLVYALEAVRKQKESA